MDRSDGVDLSRLQETVVDQAISLFSKLEKDDIRLVTQHGVLKRYPKNSLIIQEGEDSDSLYFISQGRVKIYVSDENAREVILNIQGTGEYFGELALIDEGPRSASVMTMEPSHMIVVSRDLFHACLGEHPEIAIPDRTGASFDRYGQDLGAVGCLRARHPYTHEAGEGETRSTGDRGSVDPTADRGDDRRLPRDGESHHQRTVPRRIYRGQGQDHHDPKAYPVSLVRAHSIITSPFGRCGARPARRENAGICLYSKFSQRSWRGWFRRSKGEVIVE